MKKRLLSLLLIYSIFVATFPISAFATEEPPQEMREPSSTGPISSITLPESLTMTARSTEVLSLTITPDYANPGCQWISSDSEVATVSPADGGAKGLVTGLKPGVATITATIDNLSASCQVTVEDAPSSSEVQLAESYAIEVGCVEYIHPVVVPDGSAELFTITATEPDVVDVSTVQGGKYVAIRGLKSGSSEICIETGDGIQATSVVNVKEYSLSGKAAVESGLSAYVFQTSMGDYVTRVDLACVAAAFAGLELEYLDASEFPYSDCSNLTDIERAAIAGVAKNGVMTGVSQDTFAPKGSVTRAQLASIIWRSLGSLETDVAFEFNDVPVSTWYYDAITFLHNLGIIPATGSLFAPNDLVTFEDAFTWFYAAKQYQIENGLFPPTVDNSISQNKVKYVAWGQNDGHSYIKVEFTPSTTGWYQIVSSGSKTKIDFYATENTEVVTDSWITDPAPFGTHTTNAQLYAGEMYTLSIHPYYMDDGGLALSLRGPNENLPTASISFDTNDKQLEVGDTWEPLIQVLPADATITEPHWRNSNPDVVRLVMNHENGQMSVLALAEGTATIGVTAYLTDADGTFCGYVKTYCNITVSKQEIPEIPDLDPEPPMPPSSGGSSGSSGRPSDIKTETSKNPDGSTTTTVTDKKTGTVTETTKFKDGSTLIVETKKDGTVTTTETAKNGVKVKTVDEAGEDVTAKVTIPKSVGEAVVTIPADVDYGTVAVDAKTGEVVKLSVPTKDGMTVKLDGSADLMLVDRSRDFTDTRGHWAEDAIDFATAHELFAGTSDTTFTPDSPMTRAMLMTVLARFDGQDTTGGAVWYEKAMAWARENGSSDGSNPNGSITREQLATMLWRYAGSATGDGSLSAFGDSAGVNGYAVEAMRWAVGEGLISGTGAGLLAPQGNATRAQVATILMRFIEGNLS